ncbi:hypothetical protein RRF57_001082 [Xylaria bambusicola]|uniref:Uncharacterized protein n=1 Tax=Xylaria bambusicola TaxID=326684 RepID=A0AAN7UGU0_9PEZI
MAHAVVTTDVGNVDRLWGEGWRSAENRIPYIAEKLAQNSVSRTSINHSHVYDEETHKSVHPMFDLAGESPAELSLQYSHLLGSTCNLAPHGS